MSATIHRSVSGATLADCEAQLEPGETIEHVFGYPFGDVVCLVNTASPESSAVAEKVSQDFSGAACVDCTELLANGETPTELDEAETAAYLASVEATTAGYRVFLDCPEDCEGYFSWSSCDVCGSTLGGDRHPVMFSSVQS